MSNTLRIILSLFLVFNSFLFILEPGEVSAWNSDLAQNTPISTAPGNQTRPVLTGDGSDGAIIAWLDQRKGGSFAEIYAQKINSHGTPQWTSDGVAAATSTQGETYFSTQITSDSTDGAIIAWLESKSTVPYTGEALYAQRINNQGISLWGNRGLLVASAIYTYIDEPQIVSDGSGGAIISWRQLSSGFSQISSQRISPNGIFLWGPGGVMIDADTNLKSDLKIVSDGAGGAIISWKERASQFYPPGYSWNISAQRLNASGSRLWSEPAIVVSTSSYNIDSLQITGDGAGGAILGWTASDIYSQRLNAYGTPLWSANGVRVTNSPQSKQGLQLTDSSDGGAFIAYYIYYHHDSLPRRFSVLYAQRLGSTGSPVWTADGAALSTTNNFFNSFRNAQILNDGVGGLFVVWEEEGVRGFYRLYAQHLNSSGLPLWPPNGLPVSIARGSATGSQSSPPIMTNYKQFSRIIKGRAGGAIVVWQDYRHRNYDIYAQWIGENYIPDMIAPPVPVTLQPPDGSYIYRRWATFSWTAVTDSSGVQYDFMIDDENTFDTIRFYGGGIETNSYVHDLRGYRPGTYYWKVRARDRATPFNSGLWSSPVWSFNLSIPFPLYPKSNEVLHTLTPTFGWTEVRFATPPVTYDLQIFDMTTSYYLRVNKTGLTTNSYTLSGSEALSTDENGYGYYKWRVRARDSSSPPIVTDWFSPFFPSDEFIIYLSDRTPPPTPTPLLPTNNSTVINTNRSTFAWTAVTDESGVSYELQIDDDNLFRNTVIYKTGIATSSYALSLSESLPRGNYFWRVRARDNAPVYNFSPWSSPPWSFFISQSGPTPLPAPVPLSPPYGASIGNDTLRFSWSAVTHPELQIEYDLNIDKNKDFMSMYFLNYGLTTNSYVLSTDEFPVTGTYYWRIRARDRTSPLFTSSWSSPPWSFHLTATYLFTAPRHLHPAEGTILSTVTPFFSWLVLEGFQATLSYDLQVADNGDFSSPEISKTSLATNYYILSQSEALRDSNEYYWRVRFRDSSSSPKLSRWAVSKFRVLATGSGVGPIGGPIIFAPSPWIGSISGHVQTSNGFIYTNPVYFGQIDGAQEGIDLHDIPKPPSPPFPWMELFAQVGTEKLLRDLRPISNQTVYNFKVQLLEMEGTVTLIWNSSEFPLKYDFLLLQDRKSGSLIDMRSVSSYAFKATPEEIRSFTIYVKTNSPPTVSLTYPDGDETLEGNVNVLATVSDPESIAPYSDSIYSVLFFYSRDGGANWNAIGQGRQLSTNTWTVLWNTSGLAEGVNYKVKVIAYDSKGASGEDISEGTISISPKIQASSHFQKGWNMYSFPLRTDPQSISEQLRERIASGNHTLNYTFRYSPAHGSYLRTDVGSAGWGYWLKSGSDTDFEIKGRPLSLAVFELPLETGWNQIGNPFTNVVEWDKVRVRKDGVTRTVFEAHLAGWIDKWFYSFNPVTSSYEVHNIVNGRLLPFKGYWFKARVGGLTLLLPSF